MTINDNSTKSINAAIIDLQNQIKQLQHKIGILSKNQLKEDDIEFPGKVEYADEAGKAKEADHAKTADTAKYTSETENAVHAGYADIATKATQDGSGNVITDTYATKTELTSGLAGKSDTGHTHTKSQITDFPTSLPANGGMADSARYGFFGMLGGANQADSSNFTDLLNNELCSNQIGGLMGGSIEVLPGQEEKNLGVPCGTWYNFLYIPHRTGIGLDNIYFGSLIVIPMISNDGVFYIIHRINERNCPAHRFNSVT